MPDAKVLLIGTLDTKGEEYAYLRDRLRLAGADALVADVGTLDPPRGCEPDITRDEVAAETGADLAGLTEARDRGAAITAMADAAAALARRLYDAGRVSGVLAAGGSGNTAIATRAMQALPVGVPKLMVSTVAAGDTRDYVGAGDVTLMASVTDVAGVNSISGRILANAAAAMAGMVQAPPVELRRAAPADRRDDVRRHDAVRHARARGARGARLRGAHVPRDGHRRPRHGGARRGRVRAGRARRHHDGAVRRPRRRRAVGGAGPPRGGGREGIPQVVSLGALDMVNFGARDTVPPRFEDRNLYVHNPSVTLMRTTPAECAELGRRIARKLSAATGPTALFVPLAGVSMIDAEGQPFHDPAADEALFAAVRDGLDERVELIELDCNVNDPEFATAMADKLSVIPGGRGMTGDEARARLRATLAAGEVIIGAGAGTGLSAKCAEAGGVDIIVIYNSGRYRMAGRGSLAGLMPYGDANSIVMDMGREVLPVVRATRRSSRACAAPTRSA